MLLHLFLLRLTGHLVFYSLPVRILLDTKEIYNISTKKVDGGLQTLLVGDGLGDDRSDAVKAKRFRANGQSAQAVRYAEKTNEE